MTQIMMIIPYTADLSCKKFLRKQNFKIKEQRYPISLMIDIHNQFFIAKFTPRSTIGTANFSPK